MKATLVVYTETCSGLVVTLLIFLYLFLQVCFCICSDSRPLLAVLHAFPYQCCDIVPAIGQSLRFEGLGFKP